MAIFTPRLHYYGIPTSDYYNAWNAYQGNNAMPNCVAYTYGRFNELARVTSNPWTWPTGNGNQWFQQAINLGLQTTIGNVPQVGACICWDGGISQEGHTAIIEQLIRPAPGQPPTAVRISNSLYSASDRTPKDEMPYFFMGTVQLNNMNRIDYDNGYYSIYTYQGMIYHPDFPPGGQPVPILDQLTKIILAIGSRNNKKRPKRLIIRR